MAAVAGLGDGGLDGLVGEAFAADLHGVRVEVDRDTRDAVDGDDLFGDRQDAVLAAHARHGVDARKGVRRSWGGGGGHEVILDTGRGYRTAPNLPRDKCARQIPDGGML
jgi:hypothetical protein